MSDFLKKLDDRVQKSLYESVCTTADYKEPLTLETLQRFAEFMKPLNNLFVVSCPHLPDNCYGILYVRPEDAEKWKKMDKGEA